MHLTAPGRVAQWLWNLKELFSNPACVASLCSRYFNTNHDHNHSADPTVCAGLEMESCLPCARPRDRRSRRPVFLRHCPQGTPQTGRVLRATSTAGTRESHFFL